MIGKKFILLIIICSIILGIIAFSKLNLLDILEMKTLMVDSDSDTKQPKEVKTSGRIMVKYPQDYTIVMLGDSMTESLGNSDELRAYLKKYYPNKTFEVLNYGFGSTNILSAEDRLLKETFHGRTFRPILDIDFDIILIESFGQNPLSEYPLETGLKLQTEALDKIVADIKTSNHEAKIAFVATIAPNKRKFAMGQVDLSAEKRSQWADERIAYIRNHILYAKTHQIPLVNIFEKSLIGEEGGNLNYISTTDFIHPSPTGVYFISEEIAKTIFDQKLL